MKPGDMVINELPELHLWPTPEASVTLVAEPGEVPYGSIGVILSPTNGAWVKWMVNGEVGWSNFTFLREVKDETR